MRFYIGFLTLVFLLFLEFEFGLGYGYGIKGSSSFSSSSSSDFRDYIQEIALYDSLDDSGNYLYFRSNVPDTSKYREYLKQVKRVCFRGRWDAYSSPNYENKSDIFDSWARKCFNRTFEHKSFRHLAAGNTSQSAISLYTGMNWSGREYFVSGDDQNDNGGAAGQLGGIQEQIQGFALSGFFNDSWELFEGTHFNGSSGCLRKFQRVQISGFNEQHLRAFNLTTVGSVRRNCSLSPNPSPSLNSTSTESSTSTTSKSPITSEFSTATTSQRFIP